MTLTDDARALASLAGLGCAGLLAAALLFQFVGGLAPCPLCVWQRWPHVAGAALGLAAALAPGARRPLAGLGAAAMAVGLGLALYHVGVEQGLWSSAACSAGPIGGLTTDELLAQIRAAPIARCDEIAWTFLGLSMAAWNAVASLGLAGLFAAAARRAR